MNRNSLLLLCIYGITTYTSTHCMLKISKGLGVKNSKYKPLIQKDPAITHIRKIMNNLGSFEAFSLAGKNNAELERLKFIDSQLRNELIKQNYLYSIRLATDTEKKYECVQYVLAGTLGFKAEIRLTLETLENSALDIFKYFKQTNNPKQNDIVVYSTTKNAPITSHIGIVLDNNLIESKWGISSDIVIHKLFMIPFMFGDYARFFTLKNKFCTLPKELLISLMHYDTVRNSCYLQRKLRDGLIKYYNAIKSKNILFEKDILSIPTSDILFRTDEWWKKRNL